jgi:hypothetical protein
MKAKTKINRNTKIIVRKAKAPIEVEAEIKAKV